VDEHQQAVGGIGEDALENIFLVPASLLPGKLVVLWLTALQYRRAHEKTGERRKEKGRE